MRFILEMECDNAAFDDEAGMGLALEMDQILTKVKGHIYFGRREGVIHDSNGNKVGTWRFEQ